MRSNRRPRATMALLALLFSLALLWPGAAGRAGAGPEAPASLATGPAVGLEQGLAQGRAGRSLVAPAAKRDDRERPGPALPGPLAVAVVTAATVLALRPAGRGGGRGVASAGARAPPSLQPAPN